MFSKKEKKIIFFVACVQFIIILDFMIVMPLGPKLMRILEISPQKFSHFVAMYSLSAGLTGVVASLFLDKYDRKTILNGALLLLSISIALCSLVNSYAFLLISRFAVGMFVGVLAPILLSIVSDAISIERRATAMGLVMSSFAVASILGVPIGLLLANRIGWQAPFAFHAVLAITLNIVLFKFFPSMTGHLEGQVSKSKIEHFKYLLWNKNRIIALLFIFILILGHFSVLPFLFPSIITNARISESNLPFVYLFAGLSAIVATVLFGFLADRIGKKIVFTFALLGSLGAILLVTSLDNSGLFLAILAASLFFGLMSGRTTPAITLITATVDTKDRGSFMALVNTVQQLATSIAAIVAGVIVVKSSDGTLLHMKELGYFAILFSLLALVVLIKLKVTEKGA